MVTTNSFRSSSFPVGCGTKQGDLLSQLLFIIALEPLAVAIRFNSSVEGITMGGHENKLLIFVDDFDRVLTSDPHKSVPPLLELMNSFSDISGSKIN